MKKILALLCTALLFISAMSSSALATAPDQNIIDLGDGFYMVENFIECPMQCSDDTVAGGKSGNIYYQSTLIGLATLYASFDISGSSAKATAATIAGEGRNGCTYVKGTTSLSGNKATGTATFKYEGIEKRLTLSISCSPSGVLS